jgi:hypothetical protein
MERKQPTSPPVTHGETKRLQAFQLHGVQQDTASSIRNDGDGQAQNTGDAPYKKRRFPQATANDEEFGYRIRNETQPAPRFLFASWIDKHDRESVTLSAKPIVPTMFQDQQCPRDIFSIPKREVIEAGVAQLASNHQGRCYFSPWKHSWKECSQAVKTLMTDYDQSIRIAILDTRRLPESCTIFHESFFTAQVSSPTFLVYGVIPPEAYGVTNMRTILDSGALDGISIGHDWPH